MRGALQMKYTQEIKDQCVEAVKAGKSFASIKSEIGPNPKAVQRYLVKAGVDYKALKESLAPTEKKAKKSKKQSEPVTEVIEE